MAEIKTRPSHVQAVEFIDTVELPQRREDASVVCAMMSRISGEPATMWGPSIVGFGRYHYRYDSGHEGDMCRIGFSPRKAELVLYVLNGFDDQDELLGRLGKHKTGKSCLYVKKLADVDMGVLEDIMRRSLAWNRERYPG